jgi:glycosyltransferase involved in cell wall biosynthesis
MSPRALLRWLRRPQQAGVGAAPWQRQPIELSEPARKGTWVVIAAYDEAPVVGVVVHELRGIFENVVVVDDGSRDDTSGRARRAGACVLRHALNRGQGAALQTGIAFALERGAEVVATFDADGQHRAGDLPYVVAPVAEGRADIALGSRFLAGGASDVPPLRRLVLSAGVIFTFLASGLRLTDTHNGMRAFSRRAALQIDLRLDRMAHASELIDQVRRSRLPFVEVPVRVRYTDYSRTKGQSSGAALRIALDYFVGRVLR